MSIGGFTPVMPSAAHDAKVHERTAESQQRAAQTQGLDGGNKESSAASGDRDADGRQAWQWRQRRSKQPSENEHKAGDLTGQTGTALDLDG
ncbi:MAG: hypothetical protein LBH00_02295 [Planctomycetaceae bacterium]|jgi:hypothetical protein|nr:hypothetical protein [Planctomycetaceae bacterium]